MKVVGLTGGIGSGKTTVANFFRELGVPVYIADTEAKRLMNESKEVKEKILALFGIKAYEHGKLNREHLSSKVFSDKEKLEALNRIVHPAVRADFELWKQNQQAAYVIYEAAILFEQGGNRSCDLTILVIANRESRIEWLHKRDQSTLEEIEARMAHQWPDEKKRKLADFVIENEQLEETYRKVKKIHQTLLETA